VGATYLTYRVVVGLRTTGQVVLDQSCGNGLRQVDCRPSFRFEDHAIFHNRAAFLAYQRLAKRMRLIFGMIVGAALMVGGAYVADPNRIGQLG
jgi:hypothetical protein